MRDCGATQRLFKQRLVNRGGMACAALAVKVTPTLACNMMISEATVADIPDMHRIRMSVRENMLSDPTRVKPSDYERMINEKGKGWVCKIDGNIRGFSFADLSQRSIWALFVEPGFEGHGMGRQLHDCAVGWLFENGAQTLWLTTQPGTRAEKFYAKAGWKLSRIEPNGECRLEIEQKNWNFQRR
jgi:GNAT superfamily N-acetyltransferase